MYKRQGTYGAVDECKVPLPCRRDLAQAPREEYIYEIAPSTRKLADKTHGEGTRAETRLHAEDNMRDILELDLDLEPLIPTDAENMKLLPVTVNMFCMSLGVSWIYGLRRTAADIATTSMALFGLSGFPDWSRRGRLEARPRPEGTQHAYDLNCIWINMGILKCSWTQVIGESSVRVRTSSVQQIWSYAWSDLRRGQDIMSKRIANVTNNSADAVSYTHLTLPTKRIV